MYKIYILNDPITGKTEQVYQYPEDLASPTLRGYDCILVTKQLLIPPIYVVPKEYLTEVTNSGIIPHPVYASFKYLDFKNEILKEQDKQNEYNLQMAKLKGIFNKETYFKRSCITQFFTGPKKVYKQTFVDTWVCDDMNRLTLHGGRIIS
jgi:hypothetical protein